MKHFLSLAVLFAVLLALTGCGQQKNKVLIVQLSSSPSGLAADSVYIEKALKNGGMIVLNPDIVRKVDPDWIKKYDITDAEGNYLTYPMMLNWVSAKGWKLQSVFCVNLNPDNKEFYFIK